MPRGIRVNAISPGPIDTPVILETGLSKEQMDQMHKKMVEVIHERTGASVDGGMTQL